eukprot:UN34318
MRAGSYMSYMSSEMSEQTDQGYLSQNSEISEIKHPSVVRQYRKAPSMANSVATVLIHYDTEDSETVPIFMPYISENEMENIKNKTDHIVTVWREGDSEKIVDKDKTVIVKPEYYNENDVDHL